MALLSSTGNKETPVTCPGGSVLPLAIKPDVLGVAKRLLLKPYELML